MLFSKATLFTAAAFTGLALAQDAAPEGSVKVHVVQVSDETGALKFYPEVLEAAEGELVQFQFYPKNHSVAQSSFADPCVPISESASGNGTEGFFSGFMPVAADSDVMPTFTIPVTSSAPIWYYCATGPHCQNGMVGVINPPKNNPERTIEKYRESAAESATKIPKEEDFGGEEGEKNKNSTTTTPPVSVPTNDEDAAPSLSASTITVVLCAVAAAFALF